MLNKRIFWLLLIITVLGWTITRSESVRAVSVSDVVRQQLTDETTASFRPTWSPDGRRIAFHRRIGGWKHIFTMKADGSDLKQLTRGENANFNPAWSHDNRIAFVCNRNQSEQICIINADGSGFVQLTVDEPGNDQPDWSPDSRWLAFSRACSIYIMDADGANIVQLIQGSDFHCYGWPVWSPDGANIAFRYGSASGGEIYVLDMAGNVRQLTNASGNNRKPTWSPNGKRIAFERDGQIFLINADGTGITELTPVGSIGNRYPDWSPIDNKIAFEHQMGNDITYGDGLYQIDVINVEPIEGQTTNPLPTVQETNQPAPTDQPTILPETLLGKTLDDHELVDYILENHCSLGGMHYLCRSSGIELSLTTAQRVVTIFFYAEGADGFRGYQGELPYGLIWSDTRADVERKLGPPTDFGGEGSIEYWVVYRPQKLWITYDTLSTTDLTASMHHLQIQTR